METDSSQHVDGPADDDVVPGPDLGDAVTLRGAVEAVLFVSDAPLSVTTLAAGLDQPEGSVQAALDALAAELDRRGAGVELSAVAGGYRLYTREALAPAVEAFLREGQRSRLTQAALETLAVIAYRQPVTRGRVSAIRGVNVDAVARTLLSRGLIAEVGTDPETGAGLYGTTELFLEKLGLSGLDDLPSLAPLLPDVDDLDEFRSAG
jgi:segregation and condensation protein B